MRSPRLRGIVTFVMEPQSTEYMFVYTATDFTGQLINPDSCPEGVLRWVDRDEVCQLPTWEGDRIFLKLLMEEHPFFSLKLCYDPSGRLTDAVLDGKPLPLE